MDDWLEAIWEDYLWSLRSIGVEHQEAYQQFRVGVFRSMRSIERRVLGPPRPAEHNCLNPTCPLFDHLIDPE